MQPRHTIGSFRYRRLPDGGIDYAYYRRVAVEERRAALRGFFSLVFQGMRTALGPRPTARVAPPSAPNLVRLASPIGLPVPRGRVIALHCSGADSGQWRALGATLGADYELLAPEHYGCEKTGHWLGEHAFTLADEAERTLALIDSCDQPVHLVGHSYGGGVALKVAFARPDRVASLSLYEPSAFHLLRLMGGRGAAALAEIQAIAQRTIHGVATGDHRGAAAAFVDYWGGPYAWAALRPSVQQALTHWLPKAPLDFAALIEERTPLAAYARLPMPTLLLCGEQALTPSRLIVETLWAVLPAAQLTMVQGAGHMGPLTHAAIVNAAIAGHIARYKPFGHARSVAAA